MKSLFSQSLIYFLAGFLVLLITMGFLLWGGYALALNAWKREKETQAHDYALEYLQGREPESEVAPLMENLFLVLDTDQNIIYSNHGKGMVLRFLAENTPDYTRLVYENQLLGYYFLAPPRFADDLANRKFLEAMVASLIINSVLSIILALAIAFIFSRSLSRPAVQLAQALDRMASGDHGFPIEESGPREWALIASSAKRLNVQLKNEKAMRDQWAHDITHDLRTPIASLEAQLEAMADGVLEMSQERILRNLVELKRMEKLVKDLEILMRLEQPEIRLNREIISTRSIAQSLKHRFQHLIDEKFILFNEEIHSDYIYADEDLLLRALSNLLANAFRHTPEQGSIRLSFSELDHNTQITVYNSGSFIPPEEQEKIFHRLYRGEYARKTPGSGLGLSITRQIVLLHQGKLHLESSEHKGSSFILSLPSKEV
ncbi:MAG: HAMP domain-containing histidine kinase [Spirochaetales bacterium]|nr:HAMP domain-containing histidine kinase [Spirochaetales bacterium]